MQRVRPTRRVGHHEHHAFLALDIGELLRHRIVTVGSDVAAAAWRASNPLPRVAAVQPHRISGAWLGASPAERSRFEPGVFVDPWFTPLAAAVLSFVTRNSEPALSNHSIRSFLFARLVANERGLVVGRDYPLEALFCACTLHDIGLTEAGNRGQRFEVDGADLASELLASHGVATAQIDIAW